MGGKGLVKILAPVSSYKGAVDVSAAGADEIYFGVKIPGIDYIGPKPRPVWHCIQTYDEVRKIVEHAHDHGVQAIATTQMLSISDAAQEKMKKHIQSLVEKGIDALIVTSMGILLMVKEMNLNIPICTSTYVTAMNYEAVDFFRKLGVKRVTLERHITLDEMRAIVKRCRDVETEVFVHGAGCSNIDGSCHGCVALSRRIDPSEYMEKRAAPLPTLCEAVYEIYEMDKHERRKVADAAILDAHTWCSLCHLPEIIEAGVKGIKIVGREESRGYQRATVKLYRELVDLIESGQIELFQERLETIKSGKEILPPGVLSYGKSLACGQKRCFYSPIFHAPYKIQLSEAQARGVM